MARSEGSIEASVMVYLLLGFVGSACAESFGIHGAVNCYGAICLGSAMIGLVTTLLFFVVYWAAAAMFAPPNAPGDWGKEWVPGFLVPEL